MKTCKQCGFTGGVEKFSKHPKSKGGYRQLCKACTNNYNRRISSERTAAMRGLKAQPCADCGNTFPAVCMDFDHVRGEKLFDIGKAGPLRKKWELVLAEVAKCDIVCANCHRIRTEARK